MMDFNPTLTARITAFVDEALARDRAVQPKRRYLGASRLGVACERALQYEHTQTPADAGRETPGQVLRIFEIGHLLEAQAVQWLRRAGFDLVTRQANGEPFGFSAAGGRIQGHADGILEGGPPALELRYPALWECKSMNAKSWQETVQQGVARTHPIYAAQIALYQAYLEASVPGLSQHPALFTAINKDNAALWFERVPFDGALAQRMSDRAVRVLRATDAGEWLPRCATEPTHFACQRCEWSDRCWSTP